MNMGGYDNILSITYVWILSQLKKKKTPFKNRTAQNVSIGMFKEALTY